jgi:predicted dehydrogenase
MYINRRDFIKSSSAFMAFASLGEIGLDLINPAKAYKVGLIGTGWYGKNDLFRLVQVAPVEVVALCDVDSKLLNEAADLVEKRIPKCKRPKLYKDYTKMLANHEMDIVIIGTPDHWHSLMMIDAVKAGSHVYLQKPISVDVREGEAMIDIANLHKNQTIQVGLQRRSTPHIIDAKKNYLEAGKLGRIKHVEMCCYYAMRDNRKLQPIAVPENLDWDMWTGPAPLRPYDSIPWRAFMENGNGIVGDMCVHMYDTARWMLGLGWPKKISSTGGIYMHKEANATISDTQTALFEHDEYNCLWTHRAWGTSPDPAYPWAIFIYGELGTLKVSTTSFDFVPVDKKANTNYHQDAMYEKEKYPEDATEARMEHHAAPATRRHFLDMLDAMTNKTKPVSDIYDAHISTASCILANMSMQLGRPLSYDPVKRVVINDAEATAKLARTYRSPYVHP